MRASAHRKKRSVSNLSAPVKLSEGEGSFSSESVCASSNISSFSLTQEELAQDVTWGESPPQDVFTSFDSDCSFDLDSSDAVPPMQTTMKRFKADGTGTPRSSFTFKRGNDAFDALVSTSASSSAPVVATGMDAKRSCRYGFSNESAASCKGSAGRTAHAGQPHMPAAASHNRQQISVDSCSQPGLADVEVVSVLSKQLPSPFLSGAAIPSETISHDCSEGSALDDGADLDKMTGMSGVATTSRKSQGLSLSASDWGDEPPPRKPPVHRSPLHHLTQNKVPDQSRPPLTTYPNPVGLGITVQNLSDKAPPLTLGKEQTISPLNSGGLCHVDGEKTNSHVAISSTKPSLTSSNVCSEGSALDDVAEFDKIMEMAFAASSERKSQGLVQPSSTKECKGNDVCSVDVPCVPTSHLPPSADSCSVDTISEDAWEALAAMEAAALSGRSLSDSKSSDNSGRSQLPHHRTYRLVVVGISEGVDDDRKAFKNISCTPASVHDGSDNRDSFRGTVIVRLYDDWYDTDIAGGDVIHVTDFGLGDIDEMSCRNSFSVLRVQESGTSVIFSVSDTHGLLVVHPDVLVTPSRISEACTCSRRAVISDRIRGLSGGLSGAPAVLGSLKHQLIEKLLEWHINKSSEGKVGDLPGLIAETVSDHAEALCSVGISDAMAHQELSSAVPRVLQWVHQCRWSKCPGKENVKNSVTTLPSGGMDGKGMGTWWHEVIDVEDTVCSLALGIKGQVDMTVKGVICSGTATVAHSPTAAIPVELKTGRWRPDGLIAHRAQTILYMMMLLLRDRCAIMRTDNDEKAIKTTDYTKGILLYIGSKDSQTKLEVIIPTWLEMKALIQIRNSLATSIRKMKKKSCASALPPMLRRQTCEWCFQAAECMVYHKASAVGDNLTESSGVPVLYEYLTAGITSEHIAYFTHWDQLLDLEEAASDKNSDRTLRYSRSDSLSGLSAAFIRNEEENDTFSIAFNTRSDEANSNRVNFLAGDRVTVSIVDSVHAGAADKETFACREIEDSCSVPALLAADTSSVESGVAVGTFIGVEDNQLVVEFSSNFRRFKRIATGAVKKVSNTTRYSCVTFLLEKEEFSGSSFSVLRSNVLRLIVPQHDPQTFKSVKSLKEKERRHVEMPFSHTRDLIIDLITPRFRPDTIPEDVTMFIPNGVAQDQYFRALHVLRQKRQLKSAKSDSGGCIINGVVFYPGCCPLVLLEELRALNGDQQEAVRRVLSSLDYTLVRGMPGTGKTYTISLIVRAMVAKGGRVLVTSYTHSAVDNLMEKLMASGVSVEVMARIGAATSVRPCLHRALLSAGEGMGRNGIRRTVASTKQRLECARVVGCTVLTAARHALLQRVRFQWGVMDECGQISQPAAIGAMLLSERFLLVGDDYQLPPIVQSLEARDKGMDISMFKRLGEAHPNAVVSLVSQYRMNEEVMDLANTLVYEHKLRCGSNGVAKARLSLPKFESFFRAPLLEISSAYRDVLAATFNSARSMQMMTLLNATWISAALDPSSSVVFVNTDTLRGVTTEGNTSVANGREQTVTTGHEGSFGRIGGVYNPSEVVVVKMLVDALWGCGVDVQHVGVVTPYRSQVRALANALDVGSVWARTTVDDYVEPKGQCAISTVDKFQGRDMDVIILSIVRSNSAGLAGDLLQDWRRVNVAITRARHKLIIVGSLDICTNTPVMLGLAKFCSDRNRVISTPHNFGLVSSRLTNA